jgi:hypothetical protein
MIGSGWDNLLYGRLEAVRTDSLAGGPNLKASNIIFTNGNKDPSLAMSIISSLSPSMPAIMIDGVAHGADICPAFYPNPPQSLIDALAQIGKIIDGWLQDAERSRVNPRSEL